MFTYYVKTDKDGFITDAPALDAADGLTAVTCGPTTKDYLLKYYSKYRVEDGNLVAPGNLPDMSIEGMQNIIDQQGTQISSALNTINKFDDALTKANTTITNLQDKYKQDSDMTNEAILELSDQVLSTVPNDNTATNATTDAAPASDSTTAPAGGDAK